MTKQCEACGDHATSLYPRDGGDLCAGCCVAVDTEDARIADAAAHHHYSRLVQILCAALLGAMLTALVLSSAKGFRIEIETNGLNWLLLGWFAVTSGGLALVIASPRFSCHFESALAASRAAQRAAAVAWSDAITRERARLGVSE